MRGTKIATERGKGSKGAVLQNRLLDSLCGSIVEDEPCYFVFLDEDLFG